jgi:shikimate kinase
MSELNRPLLKEMTRDELLELYNQREVLYSQASFVIINNSLEQAEKLIKDLLIQAMNE